VVEAPRPRLEIVSDRAPETLVWPSPLHVAEETPLARGSLTTKPAAAEGPLLATTMVYVVEPAGLAIAALSVLVIDTSD